MPDNRYPSLRYTDGYAPQYIVCIKRSSASFCGAVRSAQAVTEYYRADAEGEKWLKQADAILQKEMTKKAMDQEEIQALAKKMALELGCDADEETGFVSTDISMDRGQALHIDLALTGDENRYEVRSWYVYDSGNYEIDDFMPVWDGK